MLIPNPTAVYDAAKKFVDHSSSLDSGEWSYFGIGEHYSGSEAKKIITKVFGEASFYTIVSRREVVEATVGQVAEMLKEKLDGSDVILSNKSFDKAIVFSNIGNYQVHPTISLTAFLG